MFNIKKGSIIVYSTNWSFFFYMNNSLTLFTGGKNRKFALWLKVIKHKYQFTALTSRLTSYTLILFWIFFFFFGELLLLILFNYSTPLDTIHSSNFLIIKQHVIFLINTSSNKLIKHINFFIFFFTLNSLFYIINLY
jgi:hypothetical protein